MKFRTLSWLALAFILICCIGCSGSEQDPWANLPKDCEANVITAKNRGEKAVPCSGSIEAATIVNESRSAHEARFGRPYLKMAEKGQPNQVFYNGGSIMVWYENAEPTVAFYMEIYPENLDLDPQAILDFLSIHDMSSLPEAHGSPVYQFVWRDDPKYPSITADSWVGKKPDKVLQITLYGPNRR